MPKLLFLLVVVSFLVQTTREAGATEYLPETRTPDSSLVASLSAPSRSPVLRAIVLYGDRIDKPGIYSPDLPWDLETGAPSERLNDQPRDPWLAFDKVQHLTFGFLLTLGGQYALVNKLSMSEHGALPLSVGTGMVVGVTKEVYDWKAGPTRFFSLRDLAADAVGAALATVFILI